MNGQRKYIQPGRPKIIVDYELILRLREVEHMGWMRGAEEYRKRTGQWISKDTFKRRYKEYTRNNPSPLEKLKEDIAQMVDELWPSN